MWDMPPDAKQPIIRELEAKFEFLMEKLAVFNTKDVVAKYVTTTADLPAYAAASEELTAAAVVDPNEGE
jgi:hypothetical protein